MRQSSGNFSGSLAAQNVQLLIQLLNPVEWKLVHQDDQGSASIGTCISVKSLELCSLEPAEQGLARSASP